MTERGHAAVHRDSDNLEIGPSAVRWTGDALEIEIEERDKRLGVLWQRRVCGKVRVIPEALNPTAFALDPAGKHRWHCLAPRARVEVTMNQPGLRWSGGGYLDSNFGSEPIEDGFRVWHWSRAHTRRGSAVCYEGIRRDGAAFASTLRFAADGTPQQEELPLVAPLPNTVWQMERKTRADHGHIKMLAHCLCLATFRHCATCSAIGCGTGCLPASASSIHAAVVVASLSAGNGGISSTGCWRSISVVR